MNRDDLNTTRAGLRYVKAWISIWLDPYFSTFLVFGLAIAPADAITRIFVVVLEVSASSEIVAALTEPLSSKLLPAAVVLFLTRWSPDAGRRIREAPYRFGAMGGFWFGIWERVGVVIVKGANLDLMFNGPLLLHSLTGTLVAGTVHRISTKEKDWNEWFQMVAVVLVAMTIHLGWNVWLVYVVGYYLTT